MKDIKYIVNNDSIFLVIDGNPHIVTKDSINYKKILQAIINDELDKISSYIDVKDEIFEKSNSFFQLDDNGNVYSYGEKLPDFIARKIKYCCENNLSYDYIIKFWNKLKNNISDRVRNTLFYYLSKHNFVITEDGDFYAYKKVIRGDDGHLYDTWTKSIINDVGCVISMPREEVNSDPHNGCAKGLHVASFDFAKEYYGKPSKSNNNVIIKVKVNPIDVVSVPYDEDFQKMRVCKYEVIDIITEEDKREIDAKVDESLYNVNINNNIQQFINNKIINYNGKDYYIFEHEDITDFYIFPKRSGNSEYSSYKIENDFRKIFGNIFEYVQYSPEDNVFYIKLKDSDKYYELIPVKKLQLTKQKFSLNIQKKVFNVYNFTSDIVLGFIKGIVKDNRIKPSKLPKAIKAFLETRMVITRAYGIYAKQTDRYKSIYVVVGYHKVNLNKKILTGYLFIRSDVGIRHVYEIDNIKG